MVRKSYEGINNQRMNGLIIFKIFSFPEMSREGDYSVKKILKDLSKAPPSKQVAVGAGTGWIAGYLTMKAGRSMATAIGGSILLLQVLSRSMLSFLSVSATIASPKRIGV